MKAKIVYSFALSPDWVKGAYGSDKTFVSFVSRVEIDSIGIREAFETPIGYKLRTYAADVTQTDDILTRNEADAVRFVATGKQPK